MWVIYGDIWREQSRPNVDEVFATYVVPDALPPPPAPATKEDCMDGGWERFGFKNQGQCIKSVVTE